MIKGARSFQDLGELHISCSCILSLRLHDNRGGFISGPEFAIGELSSI